MIKGYIFDLDGTLLDTLDSLAQSFNRTLAKFGFPEHPADAYRYFVGDGLRACVERCLPADGLNEATIAAFTEAQQADYERSWHTAHIYPQVDQLIERLSASSARLAVLSNKHHSFTARCIEHFFPGKFELIQGYTGEFPHKPDPAGARHLCASLGLAPSEVAFIGDTATDIATAVACGNLPIGVLWGFRDATELQAAGATHIIHRPLEVITVTQGDMR